MISWLPHYNRYLRNDKAMSKFTWKKFKVMVGWTAIICYLVVALSFSSTKKEAQNCAGVQIYIRDSVTNRFVSSKEIYGRLVNAGIKITGQPLWSINTYEVEQRLRDLKTISDVDVYGGGDGYVRIKVTQRKPIVRVISSSGGSFYIDEDGFFFPCSSHFTAHVMVVTGNVKYPTGVKNVSEMIPTEKDAPLPLTVMLYRFAKYVSTNDFWNAQIQQLYVRDNHDIEFYTRVGMQSIQLGGLELYQYKLDKLYTFYQKGLPAVGWNTYKTINLKYSNQIVCTKR